MAGKIAATAMVRAVSKPRRLRSLRAPVVLTQSAVNRIKQLLNEKEEYTCMRIDVRERGCTGLSYALEYANEKKKFDEEVTQDDTFSHFGTRMYKVLLMRPTNRQEKFFKRLVSGLTLYIGSKAQLSVLGTEMDYVQDKLSSGFVFNNPNIKGTCGCGESFHL